MRDLPPQELRYETNEINGDQKGLCVANAMEFLLGAFKQDMVVQIVYPTTERILAVGH